MTKRPRIMELVDAILVVHVLLSLSCTTNTTQIDDENDDREMAFTSYVSHKLFLPVNTTNVTKKTTNVSNKMHCAFACVKEKWCYSANFKLTPYRSSLHMSCELLSIDEDNFPEYLRKDKKYIFLSIKLSSDPCKKKPCLNGGLCVILNKRLHYRCQCRVGYDGEKCQNDGLKTSIILRNYGNYSYWETLSSYLKPVIQSSSTSRWIKCWHAASDGWDVATTFHPQCDNKGPTVTIVRVGNYVFGGYTDVPWDGQGGYSSSSRSFLYSLYNTYGYYPVKLNLTMPSNENAIYGCKDCGPTFGGGHDLQISNQASNNTQSYSQFFDYYPPPGCNRKVHCSVLAGSGFFSPNDLEIFYETTY